VAAAPDWSILGVMLYVPDIPLGFGVIVSILALVAAYKFTVWYPERVRSQLDR
jgi:hypothetical protein